MRDEYIYPAIFTYEDRGISIEFPDLPGCLSCADTTEEAVKYAKEVLSLYMYGMEKDEESIPQPSDIRTIKVEENSVLILIDVFMPLYRDKIIDIPPPDFDGTQKIVKALSVKPLDGYKLLIHFSTGEDKVFDVSQLLDIPAFAELKNTELFRTAQIKYGTVVWTDDLDLCPESLYNDSVLYEE